MPQDYSSLLKFFSQSYFKTEARWRWYLGFWGLLLASGVFGQTPETFVSYEKFAAVGDGLTDDLAAICAAHDYANKHNLPVRSNPEATYHLGRKALTAIIQTDTDWNTSRFIIDDSQGVENNKKPLFLVKSRFDPVPLQIERLSAGQTQLEVRPEMDLLVYVENARRRLFIRRGLNQNSGVEQKEVFILHKDGSIEGAIDWDYETVTRVEARPIDEQPLILKGGLFVNIANRMRQSKGYNYWARNIVVNRSNTTVEGVTHKVAGESDVGHPYSGFLNIEKAANITMRHCSVDGRKTYKTTGNAGLPVSMGTYGYHAELVVNLRMLNCRGGDIHDPTRWGVVASNYMKNFLVEDCVLSRVDVHMGVSGNYTIRRTTLGHAGLNAVGRGHLLVEDTTIYCGRLINFRSDYGSIWNGDVLVRNCRWVLPDGLSGRPEMFVMSNDGTHDFGYPCSMPRVIRIEGLFIDDSQMKAGSKGVSFFGNPPGPSRESRPFPYRLIEKLEVRGLKTASGRQPEISSDAAFAKAVSADIQ